MKLKTMLAVLVALCGVALFAVPAAAGEQPKDGKEAPKDGTKEAPKDSMPDFEALLKDFDKVATLNYNADDVKTFEDNFGAMHDVMDKDEKFKELKKKNIKEAFDYMVKNADYVKWAADKKLDADSYLRKSLRVLFQHLKDQVTDQVKEGRKQLADAQAKLDAGKDKLTADQIKEYQAQLDAGTKTLDSLEKGFAQVPAATADEQKILDKEKDAIQKICDKMKD